MKNMETKMRMKPMIIPIADFDKQLQNPNQQISLFSRNPK